MRHIRLRIRSSILFIVAILTILFFTTLYTTIHSTRELEREEINRDAPIPPGVIPFWSAIDHQNIYDLHAKTPNAIFIRRSHITPNRIEELFQLIRNARTDEIQLADQDKVFPIDPRWNFKKLVAEQQSHEIDETNRQTPVDTVDSASKPSITTTTLRPDLTTAEKTIGEHDKIQLRNYVHRVLSKWKRKHQNDEIVSMAELLHDELVQKEPAYVFVFLCDEVVHLLFRTQNNYLHTCITIFLEHI